ncbi:glycosyl transferase [Curtobacterium sp. MCSS17_006]|uniref:glycosyltransferase n=1 Tax=Curtobacterium sp. MCSS17_006 TaxID=2175642 RepID=UPI000DA7F9E6|nr:glycosyltransferase [Curtobacterium sp. MCSS17_006]PZE34372.1 glycosyl transferase [Curtobacterium sp. MCSS17_006]
MTKYKPVRITHVVTYASEDGAFGGPLAVAIEQTRELAALGHDVELVMGWDGRAAVSVPGVKVRLFRLRRLPRAGFSGMFSFAMQRYLSASAGERDVLHVHLGRDLVTAPIARQAVANRTPLFLQTHGMVSPDRRLRAVAFDRLYIKRALTEASSVLTLTDDEEKGIEVLSGGRSSTDRVTNGVSRATSADGSRGQIHSHRIEILFLARLHPRKRVLTFARAAAIVTQRLPLVDFTVVGPDEGDLDELREFIADNQLDQRLHYEGPISPGHARARIAEASVYVLPSVGEVIPMSVLEALAAGTPTIITRSNGLAAVLEENQAAVVIDDSPEALAEAIEDLAGSASRRASLATAGAQVVERSFSATAVAEHLERIYEAHA